MAPSGSSLLTASSRGLSFAASDAVRAVVWFRGEYDVSTVDALSETMARVIALDELDVVAELSGVLFMDTAIVGVIVRAREFLRLRSRSLVLRSPSPCARRILVLCGLADLLDPVADDARLIKDLSSALATWVAVPARDKVARRAEGSALKPSSVKVRIRAGRSTARRNGSLADAQQRMGERSTKVAGRGGP